MPLPRRLARINRTLLNPREIARGERPVLTHLGRSSGTTYRTPLQARAVDGGFIIELRYGSGSDWVRNVLAAGSAQLDADGERHHLVRPRLVRPDDANPAAGRPDQRRRPKSEHLRLDTAAIEIIDETKEGP